MKEKSGTVFSIADDNKCVKGCTISKAISSENGYYVSYFSLACATDITPETYSYHKLWLVHSGQGRVTALDNKNLCTLKSGDLYVTPRDKAVGVVADKDFVYTEITLKENSNMNSILKAGDVFSLKDLVPYQDGKIVNMDLINDDKLKFVIMSFDKGTGLSEHAAPGEALIFALDGNGIIGYEGKEYPIKAGENFKFDKGGAHYVKADGQFKMALLLTLE